MKHALKITIILILMFLLTQLLGIFVVSQYTPVTSQIADADGNITNVTTYNLPYGMDPPPETEPQSVSEIVTSFVIIFAIAVVIMLLLMKFNANVLIQLWFFAVVIIAIGISLNSVLRQIPYASYIALALALPFAFFKIFKRNMVVHNASELLIYPGIAAIFVALVSSWTNSPILAVSIILILISLYDMYAVWHSGFMQKMAQYQIQNLKLFTGFFIPYSGKKEKKIITKQKRPGRKSGTKVSVAILGGGAVVFPLILSGVVFNAFGFVPALIVALCATLALTGLLWLSKKGKFYPAMPFISAGCFAALGIIYLLFQLS